MKKLLPILLVIVSLFGCVPQPSVSRTISLSDNSSELVQVPGVLLTDLSVGAYTDPTYDFYVSMEIVGCDYRHTFWAFNKNHAYGFYPWDAGPYHAEGRDFSIQRRFLGTDFGNSVDGWRVFIFSGEFKEHMRVAAQSGCNISNAVVIYTVHLDTVHPDQNSQFAVVVNEHVVE